MISYRDLKTYASNMVRIASRESLGGAAVVAVGSGSMDRKTAESQLRAWRRELAPPKLSSDRDLMAFSQSLRRK